MFLSVLTLSSPAMAKAVRDYQWYLQPLKIQQAHELSRGAGITVAVIDSGVDATSPDLFGQVLPGVGFAEASGTDGRTDFDAEDGHGTGMAGLIAGRGIGRMQVLGVAPASKVLPVSLGVKNRDPDLANGIRWAADHGAQVLNLSLGRAGPAPTQVAEAVRYAMGRDVVVVASTGNAEQAGRAVVDIASISGVVAVSGADKEAHAWAGSSVGPATVLAAPAVDLISPVPRKVDPLGYTLSNGTSDAAAIVSGTAALVRSRFPHMDAANVINRLIATAKDQGPPGRDPAYGFGTIRPYEALTADVPTVSRNPLLPPADHSAPGSGATAAPQRVHRGGLVGALLAVLLLLVAVVAVGGLVLLFTLTRRRPGPTAPTEPPYPYEQPGPSPVAPPPPPPVAAPPERPA